MKIKTLLIGAALAGFAGCATTEAEKPAARMELKPGVGIPAKSSVESKTQLTASMARKSFRVLVSAKGDGGSEAGALGENVVACVQQALCDAGFEVVASGPSELKVDCKLKFANGASRGNHVTCRGSVELSVRRTERWNSVTGRALKDIAGIRRFDAQGAESRTEIEAIQSFGDKLCAKLAPWIRETCQKTTLSLEMCDLVVVSKDGRTSLPADYPTQLSQTVLAISGVYGCSVADVEAKGTVVRAVVVYDKKQFPDGLLNRLRSIEKLKLAQ